MANCLAGLEHNLASISAHINHSWPGVGAHLSFIAQGWKTAAWEGLGSDCPAKRDFMLKQANK